MVIINSEITNEKAQICGRNLTQNKLRKSQAERDLPSLTTDRNKFSLLCPCPCVQITTEVPQVLI